MPDQSSKPLVIQYGAKAYGVVSSMARYREREGLGLGILNALRGEDVEFEVAFSHVKKVGDYRYHHWLKSYGLRDWCVEADREMTAEEVARLP